MTATVFHDKQSLVTVCITNSLYICDVYRKLSIIRLSLPLLGCFQDPQHCNYVLYCDVMAIISLLFYTMSVSEKSHWNVVLISCFCYYLRVLTFMNGFTCEEIFRKFMATVQ